MKFLQLNFVHFSVIIIFIISLIKHLYFDALYPFSPILTLILDFARLVRKMSAFDCVHFNIKLLSTGVFSSCLNEVESNIIHSSSLSLIHFYACYHFLNYENLPLNFSHINLHIYLKRLCPALLLVWILFHKKVSYFKLKALFWHEWVRCKRAQTTYYRYTPPMS